MPAKSSRAKSSFSYNEKRRPRRSFSKHHEQSPIPPLLQLQKNSYADFLQESVPSAERRLHGLQESFHSVFPIESSSGSVFLHFSEYDLRPAVYSVPECKMRGLTYQSSVYARIEMRIYDRRGGDLKEAKEEEVYMGELPLMTADGSFVVNGTERVVVSQLHRSPGVLFEHDSGRNTTTGKYLYSARIMPYNGSWLDFEFDKRDFLYFRIDRRRKMPVTILLKALGFSKARILSEFYEFETFKLGKVSGAAEYKMHMDFLRNVQLPFDVSVKGRVAVTKSHRIKKADISRLEQLEGTFHNCGEADDFLYGRRLAHDVIIGGEELARSNAEITEDMLTTLRANGVDEIQTLYVNEFDHGDFIAKTLAMDERLDEDAARTTIYKVLRPGDPPNREVVNHHLDGVLYDHGFYNLSRVGRMRFNRRLYRDASPMQYKVVPDESATRLNKAEQAAAAASLVAAGCFSGELQAAQDYLGYVKHFGARRAIIENLDKAAAEKIQKALTGTLNTRVSEQSTLSRRDVLSVVKYLVDLRNGKAKTDDIDSLSNRRVRAVGEFIGNQFIIGLQRVNRAIRDRLSRAETDNLMPRNLISAKAVSSAVSEFFNGNQLSQFMDQTNPLAEITHKRRVSAFGAGGLNRDRVGFEVRDVHPSHYGRVCPIETPEGPNIGLINSMALYTQVDEYGFLRTPYVRVENGKATGDVKLLAAIDEQGCAIAQASSRRSEAGEFLEQLVSARRDGEYILCSPKDLDYIDIAPSQIASVAASLIPFLEHDDANRALMGSNMQRQGVPCLRPEKPLAGTGLERLVVRDTGSVLRANRGGTVNFVDANRIAIRVSEKQLRAGDAGVDIYNLSRHVRTNQNTDVSQRPIVRENDKVTAGDVIADGTATDLGELALGQNLLVAFLPWNGYNFEDSILISERVVSEERFSSIHIIEEVVHARGTRQGEEEITRDIPHQSETALASLDEEGIINVGAHVKPGDILVGKITPKGERQLTLEEKLLRSVFGEKAVDVKDTSLRMPPGSPGVVIDVKVFNSDEIKKRKKKGAVSAIGKRAESIHDLELKEFQRNQKEESRIMEEDAALRIRRLATGGKAAAAVGGITSGQTIADEALSNLNLQELLQLRVRQNDINEQIEKISKVLEELRTRQKTTLSEYTRKLREGHSLQQDVLKTIKVYVAIKRSLQVGDKMAGRHGNKGVVSKVVPAESMPYLKDGTPVDIVLSPLGVPSRMNVGQILETHLGLAAKGLGNKLQTMLHEEGRRQMGEVRAFLKEIYDDDGNGFDFDALTESELLETARNLQKGVPFATPIFDGASEENIRRMLRLSDLPESGQMTLYDGYSGEPFERPVTVGYMYILKLHHLVDEKMHARFTGPYSLITQQPLGGKAQRGGQRFGEMEVWALEAYGAAYTLCEMLTVKSDDVFWRTKMFEDIANGDLKLKTGVPESFSVLVQEIRALGIDMDFINK